MPDDSPQTVPLSRILGAAGAPMTLTYNGHEHPVAPATLRVLDRVEKMVAKLASSELAALKDALDAAEYADLRGDFGAMLRAGDHKTYGKIWMEQIYAEAGTRGVRIVLFCCLEEGRDLSKRPKELPDALPFDAMFDVLQNSPDAKEVLAIMVPDFFRATLEDKRIPKEKRAELTQKLGEIAAGLLAGFKSPPAS